MQDAQKGRPARPQRAKGESYSVPYVEPLSDARTPLAGFFRILLVGAGTVRKDFGGNVGQVVGVGDKPLLASKECQHTVCPLTVDKKSVVGTGWSRNGEGAWSEIVGGKGGDRFACQSVRSFRFFTLVSENCRQLTSKRSATGFLRKIRYLGHRGAAGCRKDNRQE